MQEDDIYQKARHRVSELTSFYMHLIAFVIVNIGMAVFNIVFTPEYLWFLWPLLGWGVGLMSHGIGVFGPGIIFGRRWEERKIARIIEKERSKGKPM
ncbi:MAG: 2TM domain-containing protein [Bacteroidota bacterium]|nr:2TM domain-containing protein [Bacteroidota bacterium]